MLVSSCPPNNPSNYLSFGPQVFVKAFLIARYKECWYFVKDGQRFVREEETSESAKITANTSLDPALRAAVTDAEDGLLRPGALPQLSIASAAGNKALLDAVEKAGLGLGKAWNQKPN